MSNATHASASTRRTAGLSTDDPQWEEELDTESVFPGVAKWFEDRRERDREREDKALEALRTADPTTATDVPIAGADWPYGLPIERSKLDRLRRAMKIAEADWHLYAVPDPPGTILRIRTGTGDANYRFAAEIAAACRDEESKSREERRSHPHAARCARYSARVMGTVWMAAYAPQGLVPSAPPDAIAMGLASYASALVLSLPTSDRRAGPGDPEHDLYLPIDADERGDMGRAMLTRIARVVRSSRERGVALELWNPYGPEREDPAWPEPETQGWRIVGFDARTDPRIRSWIEEEVTRIVDAGSEPIRQSAAPTQESSAYACRIGLGLGSTLSRAAILASGEELARAAATEHGLTCGWDNRIVRFGAELAADPFEVGVDLVLALDRLAAIEGDPCGVEHLRLESRKAIVATDTWDRRDRARRAMLARITATEERDAEQQSTHATHGAT